MCTILPWLSYSKSLTVPIFAKREAALLDKKIEEEVEKEVEEAICDYLHSFSCQLFSMLCVP